MVVRRSRTVAAPVDDVWRIVRDPYHLPRWWPKTERVEGVSSGGWTSVLMTDKGRSIRADYRVELPKGGERRIWSQELPGTPFERLFREVVFEVDLAPARRRHRGGARDAPEAARLGALRRRDAAARRPSGRLDEALAGLAGLVEASA